MAHVTSRLLDQVEKHPTEGKMPAVPKRLDRELLETNCSRHDKPTAVTCFPVAQSQIIWFQLACGAKIPVGNAVPVHADPGLAGGKPGEPPLQPRLFDQCQ